MKTDKSLMCESNHYIVLCLFFEENDISFKNQHLTQVFPTYNAEETSSKRSY